MINIFNFLTLYSPKMNFNSPKYPIRILIISQNRTLSSDVVDFEPITNSFNDIEKHIDCIRKSEQTIRFIKSTIEPTFSIVLYSQVFWTNFLSLHSRKQFNQNNTHNLQQILNSKNSNILINNSFFILAKKC